MKKIWSVFAGQVIVLVVDLLREHELLPKDRILRSPVLRYLVFLLLFASIAFLGNFELSGFLYYNF